MPKAWFSANAEISGKLLVEVKELQKVFAKHICKIKKIIFFGLKFTILS